MQHRKKLKITAILVVILVGGIIPVIAQEWKPVVLKATAVRDDGSGYIIITLSSGTTIKVPKKDWSSVWSEGVAEAMKRNKAENAARSTAEPPSDANAAAMIRSKCSSEWPDDFRMRDYCEKKQIEALRELNR